MNWKGIVPDEVMGEINRPLLGELGNTLSKEDLPPTKLVHVSAEVTETEVEMSLRKHECYPSTVEEFPLSIFIDYPFYTNNISVPSNSYNV